MSRFSSSAVFAGAICVCLGLTTSGALAQTADPSEPVDNTVEPVDTTVEPVDTTVEPVDTTLEPEWIPGDGRPPWSKAQEAYAGPDSSWRPGDGRPPWANGSENLSTNNLQTGQPNQPTPRGVAQGIGNRGKGRNK